MNYPWFRMYAEAVDDEKLRLLAFEDRWHFVALLCLKALGTLDSDAPFLERRIGLKLGLQLPQLDELKRRLSEIGLIDDQWQPIAWGKRQFKSDHDAADRKRKQRDRDSHNDVTTTDCDSPTLDQNRSEQIQNRAEKRATRLPDDFSLTPERRAMAEAERLPADRTFAKFCDYWRGISGVRSRKLDWDATWRNWCRNDKDRGNANNNNDRRNIA
jgi:hypothetical protein